MDSISIKAAINGYVVEYRDPEIAAKNRQSDTEWVDPYRQIVCTTPEEVAAIVAKALPVLTADAKEDSAEESLEDGFMAAIQGAVK